MDIRSVDAYAVPRFRELVSEWQQQEAERAAAGLAQTALASCSDCDHDGLRWSLPDGTPSTREDPAATVNEKCDHAGMVPIEAGAR